MVLGSERATNTNVRLGWGAAPLDAGATLLVGEVTVGVPQPSRMRAVAIPRSGRVFIGSLAPSREPTLRNYSFPRGHRRRSRLVGLANEARPP
jgi:hypothetical protein